MRYSIESLLLIIGLSYMTPLGGQSVNEFTPNTIPLVKDIPFLWPGRLDGAEKTVTLKQVKEFFKMLYPDLPGNVEPPAYDVEDFRFVQGTNDPVGLVATIDFSGTGYYSAIEVVFCANHECRIYDAHSDMPNNLEEQVGEFTEHGKPQVLIQEAPGFFRHFGPTVFMYHIYTIYPDGPKDVTGSSKALFDSKIRPKWERLKRKYEQEKDQDLRKVALAWLEYCEIDYQRRFLHDTHAGVDRAMKWAGDEDFDYRSLGLRLVDEIALKEPAQAIQMLRALSASKNPDVAREARTNLERLPDMIEARKLKEAK